MVNVMLDVLFFGTSPDVPALKVRVFINDENDDRFGKIRVNE